MGTARPKVGTGGRNNRRLTLPVPADDGKVVIKKAKPARSTEKATITQYYRCAGCSHNLVDIQKHLAGAKLTSPCRQRGRYTPVLKDGTPVGVQECFDYSTVVRITSITAYIKLTLVSGCIPCW